MKHNEDFLVWRFDFSISTFFEVETKQLESLLPDHLHVVEVVPGISLINVTAFNFPEGGLDGKLPEFQELIFSIVVPPDLTRGVPKFANHVISLASTSPEHLEHCVSYYQLPVYGLLSKVLIDRNNLLVEYEDKAGKILTMQNNNAHLNFKSEKRYFQAFTRYHNVLHIADMYIEAELAEHQTPGNMGTLYNHPFFKTLDFNKTDTSGYIQMVGKPSSSMGEQTYYKPSQF